MKKIWNILLLWLYCISLAGCGKAEEDTLQGGVAEFTDVLAEQEAIFSWDGTSVGNVAGMQFYQGEPVQIWATRRNGLADICLYREDGSKELLLEGMPEDYYFANWFLDAEGGLYRWSILGGLVKMDAAGKELCGTPLEDIGAMTGIVDMCQAADGRLLITYLEGGVGDHYTLSEFDPATGKVSKVSTARLDGFGRVAAGEEGLLYMDAGGVYEINMGTGSKASILSFRGTSYNMQEEGLDVVKDFRILEDGSVEILRYDSDSKEGSAEVVQAGTETTEKVILTMRCYNFSTKISGTQGWLKSQIARFNQQDSGYLVVLDECQEGVSREDFARQTSIEMAAGKGSDLIFGDVLGDYVYGAIQKGALVDLSSYMEASGIKEEDYFPAAFGCWAEDGGVYGVGLAMQLRSHQIKKEVLGEGSVQDVGALVDALLAWDGEAVFEVNYSPQKVLEYLLQGSGNLWGMVDWETGACDFSGELFAKMLEAAERYGEDGRKDYPAVARYRETSVVVFETVAELEAEGLAAADVFFDDGSHAVIENSLPGAANEMLAVNANSAHVEGAWEFISFLLGEGAQAAFEDDNPNSLTSIVPVNRAAFETCTQKRLAKMAKRNSYGEVTEEKLAEYREFLEGARALPLRTAPLLDIIYEEAEYYFNGMKSIEEVSAVIQNRVQLYMDENK